MKKFILGFILGALLFSIAPVVSKAIEEYIFQVSDCKLMVDGEEYNNPDMPIYLFNRNGFNYAPISVLRDMSMKMGLDFKFDSSTKEIRMSTSNANIYKSITFAGMKAISAESDIYISLTDVLKNKDAILTMIGNVLSPTATPTPISTPSPTTIPTPTPAPIAIINANSLQKTIQNNLNGILYNNAFYVETTEIVQKYGIRLIRKDITCVIANAKTGQTMTLSQNVEGFIKDSNNIYYLNYSNIKSMLDTSEPISIANSAPAVTPTPAPINPADIDSLQVITQDGMTGVMYNNVFYVEKDSFYNKYNIYKNGTNKINISLQGLMNDSYFVANAYTGATVTLYNNNEGYLKNSIGTYYFNFNTLQPIIR